MADLTTPQLSETALVQLRGVRKHFGSLEVLKGISMDVHAGQVSVLLGPSGSGKSTLLRCINHLETIDGGRISVDGEIVGYRPEGDRLREMHPREVAKQRRSIGMVFQRFNLFPHKTALENIIEAPMVVSKRNKADAVAEARQLLRRVGLDAWADHYPSQLSGGQQQRIALARALVFDPKLVLMDEPLGALDKQLREHMQFEIKALHDRLGITVVYVTHDQGEALTMSDRIAVFNDGRIQQLAAPPVLYEQPENSFVAGFIGENNALRGTIEQLQGDKALVRLQNGEVIDATAVNIRESGQTTTVSIRPERVEFKPDLMPAGAHTVEAQVRDVVYMGDILRARLNVAGQDDFVMKYRNTLGQVKLSPGQTIRIGWHPEDARALDPV